MGLRFSIAISTALVASPGYAATIHGVGTSFDGSDMIVVTGVIENGDAEKFRDVAATSRRAVVVLESQGGAVGPALEMGRTIRLKGFATHVETDKLCASACALIWLAGNPRQIVDGAKVGFHASYVVTDGRPIEKGVGNALIGAYLNQIGLSQDAVIFVTSAPPEGMEWLTVEKAERIGVALTLVKSKVSAGDRPPEPYDPMGVTSKFYSALSVADGQAAAALVIPEKRGVGPFNEKAIHSFFGSLTMPLEVTSVVKRTRDRVEVTYSYIDSTGKACEGKSHVDTVYSFGTTLIHKIKALSGC